MKNVLPNLMALFLITLSSVADVSGQELNSRLCPVIKVRCLDWVEKDGLMPCSVAVTRLDARPLLRFKWTVSRGKIKKGNKAASVIVDTKNEFLGAITATVRVAGLPTGPCPDTGSSTSLIYAKEYSSTMVKEYGDITFEAERPKLDVMARLLTKKPGSRSYIIAYAGRQAYEGEANERAERAKKYLVEKHRIETERIVTVDGGFREVRSVELWIEEMGALNEPLATPTLKREEVQILKGRRTP